MTFEYLYDTGAQPHKKWADGDPIFAGRLDYIESKIKELAGLLVTGFEPAGTVRLFDLEAAPAGWLECNGAAVSRTTYAALFAAIGTRHGAGDGSTTFNLPDLRGEFLRCWDHGRGVDPGRAIGSAQAENMGVHTHTTQFPGNGLRPADGSSGSYMDMGPGELTFGDPTGENRPRNVALLVCIKY